MIVTKTVHSSGPNFSHDKLLVTLFSIILSINYLFLPKKNGWMLLDVLFTFHIPRNVGFPYMIDGSSTIYFYGKQESDSAFVSYGWKIEL